MTPENTNKPHNITSIFADIMEKKQKISAASAKIEDYIRETILKTLNISPEDKIQSDKIVIYFGNIDKAINNSFWTGDRLYLISKSNKLINFSEKDILSQHLNDNFGNFIDLEQLELLINDYAAANKINEAKKNKLNTYLKNIGQYAILAHIKNHSQCTRMEIRTDMFAKHGRIEIINEYARVISPHDTLKMECDKYSQNIIDDFKEHFPRFDDFLNFLVASRFAGDRKNSYLWLKAPSDFGKGILNSILSNLGLAVELSVKEVEKIFEGAAVGIDANYFKNAFCIIVEEFKSVKSELKQLQNTLSISAKYQLRTNVEIFAKIFFSAEHVSSLANENGIEDQFANRFNMFEETGVITDRSLFYFIGKTEYVRNLQAYALEKINELINNFIKEGKDNACAIAEAYLIEFHEKYGIRKKFQCFSESLPAIAEEFKEWLYNAIKEANQYSHTYSEGSIFAKRNVVEHGGFLYLKCPAKAFEIWLKEEKSKIVAKSLSFKESLIFKELSADGYKVYKINNKTTKAIKISQEIGF